MIVTYKWYNGETHRANILKCFLLFILNSYRNYIDVGYNGSKLHTFYNSLIHNLYPPLWIDPFPEVGWE